MQVNGNLTDVILTPGRSPDTPSDLIKQEDLNIAHTLNLVPVIFLIIFRFGSRISLFRFMLFLTPEALNKYNNKYNSTFHPLEVVSRYPSLNWINWLIEHLPQTTSSISVTYYLV